MGAAFAFLFPFFLSVLPRVGARTEDLIQLKQLTPLRSRPHPRVSEATFAWNLPFSCPSTEITNVCGALILPLNSQSVCFQGMCVGVGGCVCARTHAYVCVGYLLRLPGRTLLNKELICELHHRGVDRI